MSKIKDDKLQRTFSTTRSKSKLLVILSISICGATIPFAIPHIILGHGLHAAIHIISIALGTFLSVVGLFTYKSFKTTRLFLMMCEFYAVTAAETFSFLNLVFPFIPSNVGLDGLISHTLILLMLAFFVIGIFRSD